MKIYLDITVYINAIIPGRAPFLGFDKKPISIIGFDKEETVIIAREIGTFEQSTSHASGCKAVPKGPSTKAKLDTILDLESKLEATGLPLPV